MNFFGDFGLLLQKQIAPKPLQIDQDKLRTKFSALNVDFKGPNLDNLGSRKPAHESIKEQYPEKSLFYHCWSVPVQNENGCR